MTWRVAIGEHFGDLLGDPCGYGVISHIEVRHFLAAMLQDHENKQHFQPNGGNC